MSTLSTQSEFIQIEKFYWRQTQAQTLVQTKAWTQAQTLAQTQAWTLAQTQTPTID